MGYVMKWPLNANQDRHHIQTGHELPDLLTLILLQEFT